MASTVPQIVLRLLLFSVLILICFDCCHGKRPMPTKSSTVPTTTTKSLPPPKKEKETGVFKLLPMWANIVIAVLIGMVITIGIVCCVWWCCLRQRYVRRSATDGPSASLSDTEKSKGGGYSSKPSGFMMSKMLLWKSASSSTKTKMPDSLKSDIQPPRASSSKTKDKSSSTIPESKYAMLMQKH